MNSITFLDNFGIQKSLQLSRRYFEPELITESMYFDQRYPSTYASLAWCPEVNKYRLWLNVNHVACQVGKTDEHFMLTLAESDDAIHWKAAEVCKDHALGSNVVFDGEGGSIHGAAVMRDELDPDPSRRYKCSCSTDNLGVSQHLAPSIVATSPDGIKWDMCSNKLKWGTTMSDAYNQMFYNPVTENYQVIMRNVITDRRICTTYSKDLINWSKPEIILTPDTQDPGSSELYGMSVFFADGIFYGFLWIFETDMFDTVPWKFAGTITPELVYSYDGLHWNRTHQPVASPRQMGEYGATDRYLFNVCPSKDNQQWFITACYPLYEHGNVLYPDRIKRSIDSKLNANYTLRMKPGRFCGLQSIGEGFLRLKKFYLKEPKLQMNVAAGRGVMKVQLTDLWYKPVPGFTFEDCIPFTGDEIACVPKWKNKSVADLKGKAFGMEIKLNSACIFGVTGDFFPFHACLPQRSYGDPRQVCKEVFGADNQPEIDYKGVSL